MRKNFVYIILLFVSTCFSFLPAICMAQDISTDNNYFTTYPDKFIGRIFLSQKYAPFTISSNTDRDLNYRTNLKLNLGAGITYHSLTVNLSYGFGFLNKDKGKGKTNGLDVQLNLYPHKWAVDLLATFRKGYYLDPKANNGLSLADYYRRPDAKRDILGFSVYRVPNAHKFSYRAALTQNDVQTKSAGSLLFGGEAYFGKIKGDSSLVPNEVNNFYPQAGIDKISFLTIGPGIGYAYTLVIAKHFFVTGSAIGNIDANFSTEEKSGTNLKTVALIPDAVYKGAIGYNSSTWSVSANIIGNALYIGSKSSSKEYFLPTGILRLILAKKF